MKKNLLTFILFIFIGFISFNIAMAESTGTYTTQSGVILPKELYDELCKIYSKNYIETISKSEFDNIPINNLKSVKINEYIEPNISTRSTYFESSAKIIKLVQNEDYITLIASWKGIPNVKAYDVIAIRLHNISLTGGFTFKQTWYANGKTNVSYVGYKRVLDNGFGTSFKVQNGSNLEFSLTFEISGSGKIFGSYQHAIKSTTYEESKKYTLSSSGLGDVIKFNTSRINDKYDAMSGVSISI